MAYCKPAIPRQPVPDRFKGRVALVTGGSSGIGRAIVDQLCAEGASVVFSANEQEAGEAAERELINAGHTAMFCFGDMVEESFCRELVERTVDRFGQVDHLVNNAFSFTAKGLDAETQDWQRSFFVGPVGYARMVQAVATPMRETGGGSIVNMASISGHVAQINRWTYNAAKGAVKQLTRCQALDLASSHIRVNCLSPGWIWTREVDKAAQLDGGGRAKWEPMWGAYHMLERTGEPVECAGPTLFLLSDDASFITGADLPVDGGYLAMGPEGIGKTTVNAGSA
ncbi:MAG: SDR family oxidoreductase [Dehalococcoidia bacterium]